MPVTGFSWILFFLLGSGVERISLSTKGVEKMFGFVGVSCVGWGRGRDIGGGELGCERVSRVSVRCSMRVYLEKLVGLEDLSRKEAADAMGVVLDGDARVEELAVFLGLLRAKGETPEEVAAIAGAMCERMKPVVTNGSTLEIVGTGGDGADTVNISTMAAIVAAAAGAKVAKHGNRSISSKYVHAPDRENEKVATRSCCAWDEWSKSAERPKTLVLCFDRVRSGSADVLEAVGIPLNLTPEGVARCVEEAGIGFMFAPSHHPAMSRVQPVRRAMKIRTVFNVMGPLLNPAGTKFAIIGVYSSSVMDIMADTLLLLGAPSISSLPAFQKHHLADPFFGRT